VVEKMEQQTNTVGYLGIVIGIIAILVAGYALSNQSEATSFDSSVLESAVNINAQNIATEKGRINGVNVAIATLTGKLNSLDLGGGGGDVSQNELEDVEDDIEDVEDDVNDLQDAVDCLEEFADNDEVDEEDLEDLLDCLEDI